MSKKKGKNQLAEPYRPKNQLGEPGRDYVCDKCGGRWPVNSGLRICPLCGHKEKAK